MQIAFAIISVFWWIAIWGLSDLLTQDWTNENKFRLYITMLVAILATVVVFPDIIQRL